MGACASILGIEEQTFDGGRDSIAPEARPGEDVAVRDSPDGDSGDASTVGPPSCAQGLPGMNNCGPGGGGSESCCTSEEVLGGTFYRDNDGVPPFTGMTYPAKVSDFRLDKYEVTVGRFRAFVGAVAPADGGIGWRPDAGSGKHTHLNGGQGLAAVGGDAGPGYETGWDPSWDNMLTPMGGWDTSLSCHLNGNTWTSIAATHENEPITCETWYAAYAFCIWDGGFLPSEAEWGYAAAGGSDQRVYPWSNPPDSVVIDCTYANYLGAEGGTQTCAASQIANNVGSESPKGDGYGNKWGQVDLAGNVQEWTLDYYQGDYINPCLNCANLAASSPRVLRGGAFYSTSVFVPSRDSYDPLTSDYGVGLRCARAP